MVKIIGDILVLLLLSFTICLGISLLIYCLIYSSVEELKSMNGFNSHQIRPRNAYGCIGSVEDND